MRAGYVKYGGMPLKELMSIYAALRVSALSEHSAWDRE